MYFLAWGCLAVAALRCSSLTSQSATMFSLLTSAVSASPRPPAPMMAMLSFSLGETWRGPDCAKAGTVTAVAATARDEQ